MNDIDGTPKLNAAPSLVRKLANVMGAVERVPKTGFNKFHNYAYATESDITSAVRAAMATEGVVMVATLLRSRWDSVSTSKGGTERLVTARWRFTMHDADSAEKISFKGESQGQDAGDKAMYKAFTGAVKYALLKLFLIPTGDDPEADSPEGEIQKPAPMTDEVKAKRLATWTKDVARVAEFGKTMADIERFLGRALKGDAPTNDEWTKFMAWGKELKSAVKPTETASGEMRKQIDAHMGRDADESARKEAQRQADEAFAKAEAAPKTFPQLVDEVRAAQTQEACLLVGASFPLYEKSLTPGDLKALRRQYSDRLLILQDAASEKKRKPAQKDDVP